jgi:peptidoglycan-associated lipoprotein
MIRISRFAPLALVVLSVGVLDACRRQPVVEVTPTVNEDSVRAAQEAERQRQAAIEAERARQAEADRLARMRADSIANAQRMMENNRATLMTRVHFDYDSDALRADAQSVLDQKVAILNANPAIRLRIGGHTDARGSDEYNMALGLRRANAARRYLVDRGVADSRLETVSYGEEQGMVQGNDEAAWSQNRRAEFEILSGI